MGYETKLIIGQHINFGDIDNGLFCVITIAEIDLCKSCFIDTYIDKNRDTQKCFIYGSDGHTKITKDKYGSELVLVPPSEVLGKMKDNNKGKNKYRRYSAAIPMLESLIKDFPEENLTCVLFGH
jgi:hypothetical protein